MWTVLVVQLAVPFVELAVSALEPVSAVYLAGEAVIAVILAAKAENALMASPALGELIEVMLVPSWAAALTILANNVDHCVAVTVSPAETVDSVLD